LSAAVMVWHQILFSSKASLLRASCHMVRFIRCRRFGLGGFSVKPRHAAHHCRLCFIFLCCVLYLILKFSFSDVSDSSWNTTWDHFDLLEPKYLIDRCIRCTTV
jgi:hypothetical protein